MVEDWISQANARQRQGRAGRVKPGICFRLYTRYRFEKLMRPYQVPEMLRMPLVELCLQIKLLSLGYIKPFLSMALEPPKIEAMDSAMSLLYEVGALEGDEELTPLGYHLAKLPVDVLIGKMMVYGAIFGCLSPILSVSAFLSYKSPFVYPKDERQNVERAKLTLLNDKQHGPGDGNDIDRQSDHLLMMIAYKRWETIFNEKGPKAAQQFCGSYFLSSSVMFMIREMRIQFGTLLADIGLITLPKFNQVCCLFLLSIVYEVGWVTKTPRVLHLAGTPHKPGAMLAEMVALQSNGTYDHVPLPCDKTIFGLDYGDSHGCQDRDPTKDRWGTERS
ncbi:ATP-dependent RNA helicase dhx29-like protein [Trifolium pratense]|uniref:RNA helicase n=1 Tax=Trifolium pratense TaxID=57577 RepID=A0A2K3NY43_TRIPR|nr:ATP-dependent RNA helicase dhx29-like protein [Trifolium pratense]